MDYALRPGDPGYSKWDDPDATWGPPAPGRYCLRICYCGACPQYVPLRPQGRRQVRVVLTAEEDAAAHERGELRWRAARERGFRPKGYGTRATNVLGCQGEAAVAQWAGVKLDPDWSWEADKRRGYDVAGYQVRCRSRAGMGLNLHRGDSGRFLLVLGHEAPVMWLAGTIDAAAGFRLAVPRRSGRGERDWWEVDQRHLDPLGDPPPPAPDWDWSFAPLAPGGRR